MVKFRDLDRKKVKALGKRDVEENRGGCILISFLCSGVPSIIGVGLYLTALPDVKSRQVPKA